MLGSARANAHPHFSMLQRVPEALCHIVTRGRGSGQVVLLLGIGITGFRQVSWVLYAPVVLLGFAGVRGICAGLIFWKRCGLWSLSER